MKNKILDTFNWLILITIIGLLQVWGIIFYRYLFGEEIQFHKLMLEGYFLFFSITLLASFILDKEMYQNKFLKTRHAILFIIYPLIIIILCVALHLICKYPLGSVKNERIEQFHYTLYTMTLIFAITFRFSNFKIKSNELS